MTGEVATAKVSVLESSGGNGSLEAEYEAAETNILTGNSALNANVGSLHTSVDLKTPGGNISDQTAETKATIEANVALAATYDMITADIGTAASNAENAVTNLAITESSQTVA